ncbi:MAG: hypothetical protein IIU73_07250, partial [Selenomonadales bacterium]|nr:hypothetical protein [Selenomonadales bacterium]
MAQYDVRGVVRPEDWKTDSSSFLDKLTPEMIDLIALTALFLLIIERRESRTNFIKEGTLSSIILISLTVTPFVALITA